LSYLAIFCDQLGVAGLANLISIATHLPVSFAGSNRNSTLLGVALLILSMYSHLFIFSARYQANLHPNHDPSLLTHEMAAVDWVYSHSSSGGFSVYSYLPSVFDYPYQYLFWWHGLHSFGYLPCEYSTYPGAPKAYMPNIKNYQGPTRNCPSDIRFLIIEPDANATTRNVWIASLTEKTALVEETKIGDITVQKYQVLR